MLITLKLLKPLIVPAVIAAAIFVALPHYTGHPITWYYHSAQAEITQSIHSVKHAVNHFGLK